jgi:predicted small integral membrane protein
MMYSTSRQQRYLVSPNQGSIHTFFYGCIIITETVISVLAWWSTVCLLQFMRASLAAFQREKSVAFLSIGGEWFLMWQAKIWNGQQTAFRMSTVVGTTLL